MLAVVEGQARGGDGRPPQDLGPLEFLEPRGVRHPHAGVLPAVGGNRPAVVAAGEDDVDLVAPLRGVLAGPQRSILGVEGQTELIAVAHRVDLGQIAGLADEGIVGRRAAVVVQAHDLADVLGRILGAQPGGPRADGTADRHVDLAVRPEGDPRGRDPAAEALGDEDVADLGQRARVEPPARQRDHRAAPAVLLCRLRVGQVDQPVVLRVQGDVHQAGQPGPLVHLRHTGNGPRVEHTVADQPQGPPRCAPSRGCRRCGGTRGPRDARARSRSARRGSGARRCCTAPPAGTEAPERECR